MARGAVVSRAYPDTRTRALLAAHVGREIRPGEPDFLALTALAARHPRADEKRGSGIASFAVRRGHLNGAPALFIRRTDGTEIDISWFKCAREADLSQPQLLRRAMRRAVLDQTLAVRNEALDAGAACDLCGQRVIRDDVHVDHIEPFESLVLSFLAGYKGEVPSVFGEDPESHTTAFLADDLEFAYAWQDFHRTHATLRAVCATCNLRRTRA